jgi:hypothetical protein
VSDVSPCPGCGELHGGRYAIPGRESLCWSCYERATGGDGKAPGPPAAEAAGGERSGGPLQVLDTLELVTTEPEALDWLAEGVFCRGKATLFGGREKRGKSFVQLAIAIRMCSGGGEVAGIPVKPGRVLLVDAENGKREIQRRLRSLGLTPEHASNLLIAEARGFELRQHLALVADLARDHRADLVILDSFRALWRGDERDDTEVAVALDPVRALAHDSERTYSLTHHAQKSGEEYRGSSAIGACVDWCVMLDRHPEDPVKQRRRLANQLARFAPEREDRWLQIRSEEGDDGPVSLEMTAPFEREREAPVRDQIEADLRRFVESCHLVTSYKESDKMTNPSWTGSDLCRAIGRDPTDPTARRAIQRLADAGLLHRNGDRRWQRSASLFDDDGEGE